MLVSPPVTAPVMVHVPVVAGAVKSPLLLMEPQEADQVTLLLAVNCKVPSACTGPLDGVMDNEPVLVTVTIVDAVCPLPPVAVAFTVQDPVVAGALNRPVLSIVPQVAVQVTAALAEKSMVPFTETEGVSGEIVRVVAPVPDSATD